MAAKRRISFQIMRAPNGILFVPSSRICPDEVVARGKMWPEGRRYRWVHHGMGRG